MMTQTIQAIPVFADDGDRQATGLGWRRAEIETSRMRICPARLDQVAAIAATLDDWAVAQWLLLPCPITAGDVAQLLLGADPMREGEAGRTILLSVFAIEDGALIGGVMLQWQRGRVAWIRYWLRTASWGRGRAAEAVAAVVACAFADLDVRSVRASVDPDNLRSARLLRRVGFRPISWLERKHTNHRGSRFAVIHECTPDAFRPSPQGA